MPEYGAMNAERAPAKREADTLTLQRILTVVIPLLGISLLIMILYPASYSTVSPTTLDVGNVTAPTYTWCFECADRCDNVVRSIEDHVKGPVLDQKMKLQNLAQEVPFFFRGTDHLYLEDVLSWSDDNPFKKYSDLTGGQTFISADQHMSNYGTFETSQGHLVFDMNDFDQVMVGSYCWDIWRTGVSILIHSELNGLSKDEQRSLLHSFAYTYMITVLSYVDNDNELTYELGIDNAYGPVYKLMHKVSKKTRVDMLDKFAPVGSTGVRKFTHNDKTRLEAPEQAHVEEIGKNWGGYVGSVDDFVRENNVPPLQEIQDTHLFFTIKSIARRRGAGLGSLGSRRFFILLEGPTTGQDDDIIVDVKQEPEPEWYDYASKKTIKLNYFKNNGQRVVMATKALSTHPGATLGWITLSDGTYLVRERSPWKGSVDPNSLTDVHEFKQVIDQMAITAATNHARADNDYRPDIIPWSFEAEFAKLVQKKPDKFIKSFIDFSFGYFDRVHGDFTCFKRAFEAGKVKTRK